MNTKPSLLILFLFYFSSYATPSGVTILDHHDWGGRLGDKLMMYVKAKWVAHHFNMPFYYKPFPYSDLFAMHDIDTRYSPSVARQYPIKQTFRALDSAIEQNIFPNGSTLYTIHYFFHIPQWGSIQTTYDSQEIMCWPEIINNQAFRDELRKTIKSRKPLNLVDTPKNKISVALHVRKGGGFDHPLLSTQLYDVDNLNPCEVMPPVTYADKYWPLKFIPDQYYIDQLIRLSEMHDDAPMHVHIFTDDTNPGAILERYKSYIQKQNITFSCRTNDNHHTQNLLEDIFSMVQFDCMIRNGSNYPQIAQLLGNHEVVIYPLSCKWVGNTMIVDKVGTYIRPD